MKVLYKLLGLFILIFLLFPAAKSFGAQYSVLPDAVDNSENNKKYLGYIFVNSDKLVYCTVSAKKKAPDEMLALMFEASFRTWTTGVANTLEKSKRKEEFRDVIELLRKPFTLINNGPCGDMFDKSLKVDIQIVSDPDYKSCKGTYMPKDRSFFLNSDTHTICFLHEGSFFKYTHALFLAGDFSLYNIGPLANKMNINYLNKLALGTAGHEPLFFKMTWEAFFTILHETGHAFGLGDEYLDAFVGNSYDTKYSSPYRGVGVMSGNSYYPAGDDITGMIVLLDKFSNKKRSFRPLDDMPILITNGKAGLDFSAENLPKEVKQDIAYLWNDYYNGKARYRGTRRAWRERMERYTAYLQQAEDGNIQNTLAYKFINHKQINFCTISGQGKISSRHLAVLFENAFKQWTYGIANYLGQSEHKEDFKDIIALLRRPVELKYSGECKKSDWALLKPDIIISSSGSFCSKDKPKTGKDKKSFYKKGYIPAICLLRGELGKRKGDAVYKEFSSLSEELYEKGDFAYNFAHQYGKNKKQNSISPIHLAYNDMLTQTGYALGIREDFTKLTVRNLFDKESYKTMDYYDRVDMRSYVTGEVVTDYIILLNSLTESGPYLAQKVEDIPINTDSALSQLGAIGLN